MASSVLHAALGCLLALYMWKVTKENVTLSFLGCLAVGVILKYWDQASFPFDILILFGGLACLSLIKTIVTDKQSPRPLFKRIGLSVASIFLIGMCVWVGRWAIDKYHEYRLSAYTEQHYRLKEYVLSKYQSRFVGMSWTAAYRAKHTLCHDDSFIALTDGEREEILGQFRQSPCEDNPIK